MAGDYYYYYHYTGDSQHLSIYQGLVDSMNGFERYFTIELK